MDFALNVHDEISGRSDMYIFKIISQHFHFSLCIFLVSLPCFLPTHDNKRPFHISVWDTEQNAYLAQGPKKRVWQPKRLSVTLNSVQHLTYIVSSQGRKVSCKTRSGLLQTLWWGGRRLTVVQGKDVAVGKREKHWLWSGASLLGWKRVKKGIWIVKERKARGRGAVACGDT